ncbi:MAG: LruC domain-containing protein [Bacteroidales bacterium]
MKKFIKLFAIAACLAAVTSCVKDDTGNGKEPTEPNKLTDLVIPAGFDWRTSKEIQCSFIPLSYGTRVKLFTASDCSENCLLANLYISSESNTFTLTVPKSNAELYMQYMQTSGAYKVVTVTVSDKMTITIPNDCKAEKIVSNTKAVSSSTTSSDTRFRGTMLFEDLYPNLGDYDFNDLVVAFDNAVKVRKGILGEISIVLDIVAAGGSLPNDVYIRVEGVNSNQVGDLTVIPKEDKTTKEKDIIKVEKVKNPTTNDSELILHVTANLNTLYFNTDRKYNGPKQTVGCTITFNPITSVKYDGKDIFDIFIGRPLENGNILEIHERQYGSTFMAGSNGVLPGNYKFEGNFVWAIKVIGSKWDNDFKAFPFPYEKEPFMDAYPNFKSWVTTSSPQDWYMSGINDKLIKVNY